MVNKISGLKANKGLTKMDWLKTVFSPKPDSNSAAHVMNPSTINCSTSKKRSQADLNPEMNLPIILNPQEPSKKLQKTTISNSFESSPALIGKSMIPNPVPSKNSNRSPQRATTSTADNDKFSSENIQKGDGFSSVPVGERLTNFLSMKGDSNEPLTPKEVKMITELLTANPSLAVISELDQAINLFRLNHPFQKVCCESI